MDNEVLVLMLLWFWFTVNDAVIFNGAPKGLFPSEPKYYRGPKLKVAIIGAGLAGMSTAVELLDQGHKVDIYESRTFIGGKVGSVVDKKGNQIEMGLHVIFGCYNNLFRLMKNRVIAGESSSSIEKHLVSVEVGTSLFQFIKGALDARFWRWVPNTCDFGRAGCQPTLPFPRREDAALGMEELGAQIGR
ncbi:hypothetical protein AHAS_Ahas11G0102300 [Arachis hypogaea]